MLENKSTHVSYVPCIRKVRLFATVTGAFLSQEHNRARTTNKAPRPLSLYNIEETVTDSCLHAKMRSVLLPFYFSRILVI